MALDYSWIIPIRNESQSLNQLFLEISQVMRRDSFEIIAVDDASEDNTLTTLKSLTSQIPQLKLIHLKSHQGKWAALSLGIKASEGNFIITIDSDLQDNPQEVRKLLAKLKQGYDLVSGWRKVRFDPIYKVLISKVGNFLVSALTKRTFHDLNSPFKVYRREVLENLPKQGSLLRFSMLFTDRLGYKITEVNIKHRPRLYGKSKFGIIKYVRILYDLILTLLLFSGSGRIYKK